MIEAEQAEHDAAAPSGAAAVDASPTGPLVADLVASLGTGGGDAVFGDLNDLVVVVGPDLRVEYANAVAEHVLGRSRARLVGRRVTELLHPADVERALHAGRRAGTAAAPPAVPAVFRMRHGDGSWRSVQITTGRLGGPGREWTVVVGRLDEDQAVQRRITDLLTEGASVDRVVDLIPSFGGWRFPELPFAVAIDGLQLARQVVGGPVAQELFRVLMPGEPWARSPRPDDARGVHVGEPVRGTVAELDGVGRAVAVERGMSQWVLVPVRAADGVTGAVVVGWTHPTGPALSAVEDCVRSMARSTALVLEWHLQRTALERAATSDPLTGVANRGHVLSGLHDALARGDGPVAVLHLDLDRFKAVNGTWGHTVGDAVLVEVARRVSSVLRPGDLLGRVGSDELVVVCAGVDARPAADQLAAAVIDAMARPVTVAEAVVEVGVSIGVAIADRVGGPVAVDDLLARADTALSMAKGSGGGRVVVTSSRGGLDQREPPAGP
ncbi:MAG TPA: GGDEF domain-containing protein [Acidimicrobiales bacterium]|nr:GGDEF domain-containing protein [Acidimicrobiales bacterium]